MTITASKGLSLKEIEQTLDTRRQFTPTIPDPIFWSVVNDLGMPELSHQVDVHFTVYEPTTPTRKGKHWAPDNKLE